MSDSWNSGFPVVSLLGCTFLRKREYKTQEDMVPRALVILGLSFPLCRAEEVPVRHLLPVWPDPGYPGVTEPEDEGPGLCHLQGSQQCHQCLALHAGFPFLRQAHGEHCACGSCVRACVCVKCYGRWDGPGPPVTCSPVP